MVKIFVIYYSTYGHIAKMAKEVKKGVESAGVHVELYQVQETLPDSVLQKMHAAPKDPHVPVIDVNDLPKADGYLFGYPTRFGTMPAQMKAFFDATGGLWGSNALYHKFAGIFFSSASQGGGQETTALTSLSVLAHHGMIYVPLGYKLGDATGHFFSNDTVRGGSAWGAGTLANGDGSRQPTELELKIAEIQGHNFATVVKKAAH